MCKRKTYFFLMCTFLYAPVLVAEEVLPGTLHTPRPGDEIIKQQVEYKDPGRSGENILWDFGKLQALDEEYILFYHNPASDGEDRIGMGRTTLSVEELSDAIPIVGTEHNTDYYYLLRNDSLLVTGHRNATVDIHYHTPVLSCTYPLGYGKETSGEYKGEGMYCGRIPMFLKGTIHTVADAYGMMVLPDGDTLRQVLRIKSSRNIRAYVPAAEEEEADMLCMQMDTYLWYVKGYRYPIFETIRTFDPANGDATATFSTSFFYPPQQHYYLQTDPENLAVLFGEEDNKEEEYPGWGPDPGEGFSCNFYPNPVKDMLTIEYYILEGGEVEFGLYDLSGRQLVRDSQVYPQGGIYRYGMEMGHLQEDTYILKIKASEKEISEIIFKIY